MEEFHPPTGGFHPPSRRAADLRPGLRHDRRTYLVPDPSDGRSEQFLHPQSLLNVIRRRKWSMAGVFLIVMAVAAAVLFSLQEKYQSTANFLVEEAARAPRESPVLSVLERLGQANTIETEIEILGSRRVVEPVVERLQLHVEVEDAHGIHRPSTVFPTFEAGPDAVPGSYALEPRPSGDFAVRNLHTRDLVTEGDWDEDVAIAGLRFHAPEEVAGRAVSIRVHPFASTVQRVRARIQPRRASGEASVIQVSCEALDPHEARDLCAAVSETYLGLRGELQRAEAVATAEFLTDQVKKIETRLTAAEDSLESYGRRNRVVALDTRAEEEVRRYTEVRAQRELLQAELASLDRLTRDIESTDGTSRGYRNLASFPTFLNSNNRLVSGLVGQLVDLENQRSELALRRTEENADLQAMDARIGEVEDELKSVTSSYADALRAQVASLGSTLENAGRQLTSIPERQVQSARLERQVSLLEELYRFLQTRLREAEVAQAVELPSVQIIDRASLPTSPSSPNRRLGFGLAMVVGLAAAFLVGAVQEFSDTRLREPLDVERRTGIPVLTAIPQLKEDGRLLVLRRNGKPVPVRKAAGREQEVAMEGFRNLAVELRLAAAQLDEDVRLVTVTSAGRGEGKTFTACNLALISAYRGTRTLLVDGDVRAPAASRLLGLPTSIPGLAEVLAGRADLRKAIQRVELPQGELNVLRAGSAEAAMSSLADEALPALLARLREEFDLVVIDAPPLNLISDAVSIAARTDAVLLVVRGGVTQREELETTLNRLDRAGARVAGIVVNGIELPEHYYSYSGYDT